MNKYFFKALPLLFASLFLLNACRDGNDGGNGSTGGANAGAGNANAGAAAPTTKSAKERITALHTALNSDKLNGRFDGVWNRAAEAWIARGQFNNRELRILAIDDLITVMSQLGEADLKTDGSVDTPSRLGELAQKNLSTADASEEYNKLTASVGLSCKDIADAAERLEKLALVPSHKQMSKEAAEAFRSSIFLNKDEMKERLTAAADVQGNGTGQDENGEDSPEEKGDNQITLADADLLVELARALKAFAS